MREIRPGTAGNSPVRFAWNNPEPAFHKFDHIFESDLKLSVHCSVQLHTRLVQTQGRFAGSCFLNYISVRHNYDHGFRFSAGNQIVQYLRRTSQVDPGFFVAPHPV